MTSRRSLVFALGLMVGGSACALLAGIDDPTPRVGPDADAIGPDGATDGDAGDPGDTRPPCTKTIGPSDDVGASVGGAGSVLCLASGAYHQTVTVSANGTADSPITIQAAPGATPVLDGQGKLPGGSQWAALVKLEGSYIVVDGLEIANSAGRCVDMSGPNNQLKNSRVHHCYESGVLASGDGSIVDSNRVWEASLNNLNGRCEGGKVCSWASGIAAARDLVDGITHRAVLRRNVSYDNWGEGISTFEAEGTLIEGNVLYNDWNVNLFVADAPNVLVRDNLVYNASPTGGRGGHLTIADLTASKPRSSNVVVTNNLLYGASLCEACWTGVKGLRDIDFNHNTIVAGKLEVAPENGTNIVESANCQLSASEVPGLGAVTPGSLTPQSFAGAKCPPGTGADMSKF